MRESWNASAATLAKSRIIPTTKFSDKMSRTTAKLTPWV